MLDMKSESYDYGDTRKTRLDSQIRSRNRMRSSIHGTRNQSRNDRTTDRADGNACRMNSKRERAITDVGHSENTSSTVKKTKMDIGDVASELTIKGSSSSSSGSSREEEGAAEEEEEEEGVPVAGGEVMGEVEKNMTCVSHGSISIIGRRRAMEDAVTVVLGVVEGQFSSYDFFAVYDGHGGCKVSQACSDRMHQLLVLELEKWPCGDEEDLCDRINWEEAMASCFKKMDDEVSGGGNSGNGSSSSSGGEKKSGGKESGSGTTGSMSTTGSTAVVVVVGKETIVVANCGDSRAVLCRGGLPIPLSRDHKPDRPDEQERVEAAGGKIIDWHGCRVSGVLATSRSIGDQYLKPYVISEPEVTVNERAECDNFIIIASDGIWDVLSNDVACQIVSKCLEGHVKSKFVDKMNGSYSMEAAAMLAELAMARGSNDNISVIVVELKKISSQRP